MIHGRRNEALSHSNDGVRDRYIKQFRHNDVADCTTRFVCNDSEPQGHRQPRFRRVGQFMRYLEPHSTN